MQKNEINTEKTILLRNLRAKVRDIGKSLREVLEKKSEREYEEQYRREKEEKRTKANTEVNTIFGTTTDNLKPDKDNEKTFAHNFNMFGKYKEAINDLRTEIRQLMGKDTSEMTQQLIDDRDLCVQAKISTMKTIAKEYEKHYHNLKMIDEEIVNKIGDTKITADYKDKIVEDLLPGIRRIILLEISLWKVGNINSVKVV